MSRSMLGTTQRTWVERENNRVVRAFHPSQWLLVSRLHDLGRQLSRNGVPIQLPISEPTVVDGRVIVHYAFCQADPRDYEGKWYVPRESTARRREAATVFSAFQQAGMKLVGPAQPLDYPYCNTVAWLFAPGGTDALVGLPKGEWRSIKIGEMLVEFERIVNTFVAQARLTLEHSPWGLCHGDYHSGNTIFVGSEIGHVVDFGFWIHHPLAFDLAVALELWGRDYAAEHFTLHPRRMSEFLGAYVDAGGPVDVSPQFVTVLPLARLWLEMHTFRAAIHGKDWTTAGSLLADRIFPRLHWYLNSTSAS